MTKEDIKAAIARAAPFTIFMADGSKHEIPHEDYIAVPPKGTSIFVFDDDGYFYVLSLRLIASLKAKQESLEVDG